MNNQRLHRARERTHRTIIKINNNWKSFTIFIFMLHSSANLWISAISCAFRIFLVAWKRNGYRNIYSSFCATSARKENMKPNRQQQLSSLGKLIGCPFPLETFNNEFINRLATMKQCVIETLERAQKLRNWLHKFRIEIFFFSECQANVQTHSTNCIRFIIII